MQKRYSAKLSKTGKISNFIKMRSTGSTLKTQLRKLQSFRPQELETDLRVKRVIGSAIIWSDLVESRVSDLLLDKIG